MNLTTKMYTIGLTSLSAVVSHLLNSFLTETLIVQLLPGFIFGVALIIPNFKQSRLPNNWVLLMPLLFSMLNVFLLFFGMMLGILNNSYSDKSGEIFLGLVSGIVFIAVFNIFYGLERPLLTYLLLGVIVAISLLWDYLFYS